MRDLAYILAVMRRDTDALGWLPAPTVRDRFVRRGQVVIQRDRRGRRCGYLLHSTPRPGQPLRIHQAAIELDKRRRKYATQAVRTVLNRALAAGSSRITLRCAADLDANAFWLASGFTPVSIEQGGARRRRLIVTYHLDIAGHATPSVAPQRCGNRQV